MSGTSRWVYLVIVSIPAIAVYVCWFIGSWKIMIICVVLSSIVWLSDPTFGVRESSSLAGHLINTLFNLVLLIYAFSRLYENEGLIQNGEVIYSLKTSIYFSIVTLTTLGYGDYHPSESAQLWAAAEGFLGYIYMAVVVGLIVSVIVKNPNKTL